jgi:hypothetical protein
MTDALRVEHTDIHSTPVVRQNRIEGHERLQRGRDIQAIRGRAALRPVLK